MREKDGEQGGEGKREGQEKMVTQITTHLPIAYNGEVGESLQTSGVQARPRMMQYLSSSSDNCCVVTEGIVSVVVCGGPVCVEDPCVWVAVTCQQGQGSSCFIVLVTIATH